MSKNGYIITKSNYTLKKPHCNVSSGTVYERDFMTTNNLGGWDSDSIPNSENSFKMVSRKVDTAKRQHYFGDYLKNEYGNSNWTLASGASKQNVTSESKIELKSNNTTLLSYAYYGNCTQLVESSIRKIISNFPAEMYSTDEEMPEDVFKSMGTSCIWAEIEKEVKYIFNNEFEIDITSNKVEDTTEVNSYRYMCLSYMRYHMIKDGEDCGCLKEWKVINTYGCEGSYCEYDKEIIMTASNGETVTIRRYILKKKPLYLIDTPNVKIKLCKKDTEAFFNNLDDFQKLLLNRDSNPLYTAKLDFPHETENGIETYKKTFTWPCSNDFNIDITSRSYNAYVNSLLDLAAFYDEYETDNLWKNMTHDSIKNMDISFSRKGSDEDKEDYNEGTTKLEGLLWAYGRFFDELKRYVDNIKDTNAVTYNGEGNLPDYFLTDTLNLGGWEITSAVKGLTIGSEDTESWETSDLFPGKSQNYTANDANIIFLKNLKLNSKNILAKKGTRRGIEEILGLFGLFSDDCGQERDYSIDEYINVAKIKGNGTHVLAENSLSAETYNNYKGNISTDSADGYFDTLEGLPVILFYYYNNEGKLMKTIIPWFKGSESLDGNPYFQMYGGWEKISENDDTGNTKYSETIGYLNIVDTITDLATVPLSKLPKNEDNIIYVTDITEMNKYFPEYSGDTHYFILKNKENVEEYGENGWHPAVSEYEIIEVEQIKSIVDEYRGNNPHAGYGNYDDGKEYLKYFEQIFHSVIEEDNFQEEAYDCESGTVISAITSQGFDLSAYTDNKKCYFFYDKEKYTLSAIGGLRELVTNEDKISYTAKQMKYVSGSPYGIDVRDNETASGGTNTIYAEPSILNVKTLKITFRICDEQEKKYINEAVLPYLMQMVPSTTILEINFKEVNY